MRLILASDSPRRRELLETLGLVFEVESPDVDESRNPGEAPAAYVERIAREKAGAVAGPGRLVVAGDTAVVHEGKVLGKPAHPEEAMSMLRRLQGEHHEVFTGVAVVGWDEGPIEASVVDATDVAILPMTDHEIASYVSSGEPMDKAGAYGLQGAGGRFVEKLTGSPFTVVGLPIHLLPRLIAKAGGDFETFLSDRPE
jgi:septum formation protein